MNTERLSTPKASVVKASLALVAILTAVGTVIVTGVNEHGFMRPGGTDAPTLSEVAAIDNTQARSFPGCPLLIERFAGDCVRKLQNDLNIVHPEYRLAVDGAFGPNTRIAVLDFQGRNHLGADGNVGGITADALSAQLPPPVPGALPSCLDRGMVSDEQGRCVSDGVVGGGKPLTACLKEAVIDEARERLLERAFTRGKFASWKDAFEQVKRISPAINAYQAFKCGWWDLPTG
jgi:peptidoglycan hydrolase-like protein with peptidoglycan-binding domain